MAKAWMPLYWGDYFSNTRDLSMLEHSAYLLLIGHYWENEGLPKANASDFLTRCYKIVGAKTADEKRAVQYILKTRFQKKGVTLINPRVDQELAKTADIRAKRSASGKKGGRPALAPGKTKRKANVKPSQSQSQSPGKTYERAFLQAWKLYPKREGNNPKLKASKAWNARRAEGISAKEMIAGVKRYAAYVRGNGDEGTRFVMQAATFFGPDTPYVNPWKPGKNAKKAGPPSSIKKPTQHRRGKVVK